MAVGSCFIKLKKSKYPSIQNLMKINQMLVFEETGKPKDPEESSQCRVDIHLMPSQGIESRPHW